MKNIFKVFLVDAKRITTNVVAIVIVMGLCIIPALYAWFNIMSNWDPYGESATSQMHISVYSNDKGFTYGDISVNIGDTVIDGLKSNTSIGWVFCDSEEEAMEDVYSGDSYATFIIPDDFTEDMLSFLSGEIENPKIEYYENSKKNAIATKITSKVKTTVQQSVNTSLVSEITELLSKSGEFIVGDSGDGNLLDTVLAKLQEMDESLGIYSSILNTFVLLTDSANDIVDSTQSLLPSVEGLADSGQSAISGVQGSVLSGTQTMSTITKLMDSSFTTASSQLDSFNAAIQNLNISTNTDLTGASAALDSVVTLTDSTLDALSGMEGIDAASLDAVKNDLSTLKTELETFQADAEKTAEKLDNLKNSVNASVSSCKSQLDQIKSTFDNIVSPNLSSAVYDIEYALVDAQAMLGSLDNSFPNIESALSDYEATLQSGNDSVSTTKEYVDSIREGLNNIISGLNSLSQDEQYKEVVEMLKTDPTLIAEFVTSPLSMEEEKFYEIETYGSAMSPFYTVLALWVGGLITVALVHVKVKECPQLEGVRGWQKFFGRYISFFIIGQIQTLITVFGDLFYVEIQCKHPFLFWLACAVTSLVFTFMMYALTVAWGNIGEAIAVVIMVIQVAGAGGTFPVEVLPEVYQSIYKFMPFKYAMNALRECVGGMYGFEYGKDIGILCSYIAIFLVVGLFLGRPFKKLIDAMERSKERSGLMM